RPPAGGRPRLPAGRAPGRHRCRRSGGCASHRPDPAQSAHQRDRARRRPPRARPDRLRRGLGGGRRPGSRPRHVPRGRAAGLRPVLARGPVPGPHHRGHRTGAVDLRRGRPPARGLAAGLGPGGRGRRVPPDHPTTARARPGPLPAAAGAFLRPGRGGRRRLPDPHGGDPRGARGAPEPRREPGGSRPRERRRGRRAMWPRRRPVLRAAGAAAVLGLGAACARIPTSSPISPRTLTGQTQPGAPYVQALPPAPGATPEEVVAGFVQAGVGSEEDFAVARDYLTAEAAASWDPEALITIYAGSQELKVTQAGEGRLGHVLHTGAHLDEHGVKSLLSGPTSREIEVAIEEVDGQWRLSEVPDGIYLSEAAFETLYGPARLYFLDARERHLVPDHRWFPL